MFNKSFVPAIAVFALSLASGQTSATDQTHLSDEQLNLVVSKGVFHAIVDFMDQMRSHPKATKQALAAMTEEGLAKEAFKETLKQGKNASNSPTFYDFDLSTNDQAPITNLNTIVYEDGMVALLYNANALPDKILPNTNAVVKFVEETVMPRTHFDDQDVRLDSSQCLVTFFARPAHRDLSAYVQASGKYTKEAFTKAFYKIREPMQKVLDGEAPIESLTTPNGKPSLELQTTAALMKGGTYNVVAPGKDGKPVRFSNASKPYPGWSNAANVLKDFNASIAKCIP